MSQHREQTDDMGGEDAIADVAGSAPEFFVAPPKPEAGAMLGSYRVISQLGGGSTCHVFLAEHQQLGRKVALKLLRPTFSADKRLVGRFIREARAVNRIRHPHIIEVTDLGHHPVGPYFVMELLDGSPLSEVLEREGPLAVDRCLQIGMQVCDAMETAHQAGIIHRDLKPDNIFLVRRSDGAGDFIKLLDFGIAKVADIEQIFSSPTETVPGTILGSPAYMSPEQVHGKQVDHRTDIYALGIVLYELLTAKRPFSGDTLREVLAGHVWRAPVPPSAHVGHIDAELEALVLRCMAKEAEERPQTMAEVGASLEAIARRRADFTGPGAVSQDETARDERARDGGAGDEEAQGRAAAPRPTPSSSDEALVVPSSRQWTYALAILSVLCLVGLTYVALRADEMSPPPVQESPARPRPAGATAVELPADPPALPAPVGEADLDATAPGPASMRSKPVAERSSHSPEKRPRRPLAAARARSAATTSGTVASDVVIDPIGDAAVGIAPATQPTRQVSRSTTIDPFGP